VLQCYFWFRKCCKLLSILKRVHKLWMVQSMVDLEIRFFHVIEMTSRTTLIQFFWSVRNPTTLWASHQKFLHSSHASDYLESIVLYNSCFQDFILLQQWELWILTIFLPEARKAWQKGLEMPHWIPYCHNFVGILQTMFSRST